MPTRDLSQRLDADATVYPGDPAIERAPAATHDDDGYRVTDLRLGSHSGTHVDAPAHTEPDGATLDEFDLDRFVFDAELVDCTEAGARDPIGPDALPPASDVDLLAFRTGWDAHWGTDRYFDHPYLCRETAAACADRGVAVALDALSPDPSPSETGARSPDEPDGVPAHRELLGAGSLVVENLTGLDGVPERFELRAYPLALPDADGSPVRAVAVW